MMKRTFLHGYLALALALAAGCAQAQTGPAATGLV